MKEILTAVFVGFLKAYLLLILIPFCVFGCWDEDERLVDTTSVFSRD